MACKPPQSQPFLRNENGTVAILFALCLIPLCGCVALAIDFARAYNAGQKLSSALDRAALAGAKLMDVDGSTTTQVVDRATSFFNSQIKILGMPIEAAATLSIAVDWTNSGVTATAELPIKSAFAATIGMPTFNAKKSATVVYKMKKIELSLVLDVTGSMSEVPSGDTLTKMESLKTAAKDIVDTMYDLAANDQAIRIALAPYSNAVNAGSYASVAAAGATWSNSCVVERTGSDNATDTVPSASAAFRPYEMPYADVSWSPCPAAQIQPLVGRSQRTTVKTQIDSFIAEGGTAGHIGTAWGWYLVSNKWASIFPTANKPLLPSADVVKNVVIMTDGVFNMSYINGPSTASSANESESYNQFKDLCDNMKTDKVNIYTIGFGLGSSGGRAESELKNCATSSANFFSAANSTELQNAFKAIADRISQLRISK